MCYDATATGRPKPVNSSGITKAVICLIVVPSNVKRSIAELLEDGQRELEVAELAAGAAVEDRAVEPVAAPLERGCELGHEHAEVGVVRPGVHLRDEQDAHRRGS